MGLAGETHCRQLRELRNIGHRDYLVIQPFAPAVPGALTAKAAETVKTHDGLGLVIRLV